MPKRGPRASRRRASNTPARADARPLLDRILDTPHLPRVVPRLAPELLHRVIRHGGLEACGELVALASPAQLAAVFDLDLWRANHAGLDEQFDAERFLEWLDVLLETGASVAARVLADADIDLVVTAFARHLRVFDLASGVTPDNAIVCELGGYLIAGRREDSWDTIVGALNALDVEQRETFHRVMRGCRSLSNSAPEIDGLDDLLAPHEQGTFDLAFTREQRRAQQGYMAPPEARAFLQMSREQEPSRDAAPTPNPVARAYFRAVAFTPTDDCDREPSRLPSGAGTLPPRDDSAAAGVAAILDACLEVGVLSQQPRALLQGACDRAPRLARIQAQLQFAARHDAAAFSMRSQELAFLANTLVAGCSIQERAFTPQEASDAAMATCNLGLENGPSGNALPDDFLIEHDLVGVFQAGWSVLHRDVCMHTAQRLLDVLAGLRCADEETQDGLDALWIEMTKQRHAGTPWRARDALDVVATLDMPAWAALLGLLAEYPVIHSGIGASQDARVRQISATAFEFISENAQIALVRDFMRRLPDTLNA